jgi:hypothetical protein
MGAGSSKVNNWDLVKECGPDENIGNLLIVVPEASTWQTP